METLRIFAILVNLVLVKGGTEIAQNHTHLSIYANAIGKAHYNPWACNYRSEPGYKCISCSAALHCFPANFALLVQCAGLFPFCRNGYCSRFKTDGCYEEHTFAEGTHGPLRMTTTTTKATTVMTEVNEATTGMTEVDEATTVVTDVNKATTVMTEANEVTPYYDILQQFLDGGDISKNTPAVEPADRNKVPEVVPSTLTARTDQNTNGKYRQR